MMLARSYAQKGPGRSKISSQKALTEFHQYSNDLGEMKAGGHMWPGAGRGIRSEFNKRMWPGDAYA